MASYCPACGENVDAIVARDRVAADALHDFPPLTSDQQLAMSDIEFVRRLRGWMGGEGEFLADSEVHRLWEEYSASRSASFLLDSWLERGNFCGWLIGRVLDAERKGAL